MLSGFTHYAHVIPWTIDWELNLESFSHDVYTKRLYTPVPYPLATWRPCCAFYRLLLVDRQEILGVFISYVDSFVTFSAFGELSLVFGIIFFSVCQASSKFPSAKMQSKFSQKCSQNCSQNAVKMQPKCNQNAVQMQSKCSANAVKMQPKYIQNAIKIKSLLGMLIDCFQSCLIHLLM